MRVTSAMHKGIHHNNFNEDNQFAYFISEELFVCAVMDGCSTANESHFASSMFKKSLHKSVRILKNMHELETEIHVEKMKHDEIANFMLRQLFEDLKRTKRLFFLAISYVQAGSVPGGQTY